jgi:hypothetical protein
MDSQLIFLILLVSCILNHNYYTNGLKSSLKHKTFRNLRPSDPNIFSSSTQVFRQNYRHNHQSGHESASLMAIRPVDIAIDESSIRLNTGIYQYQYEYSRNQSSTATILVDLYSMVHVADKGYYDEIELMMRSYDVVLYELITDNANTVVVDSMDGYFPYKRQLVQDIISIRSSGLATSLNLSSQLMLNMKQKNWFIADLDSKTIQSLESKNVAMVTWNYVSSLLAGRTSKENLLKTSLLQDAAFTNALRLLLWLIPCPELGQLVLDWSRMRQNAGGISPVLNTALNYLSIGRFDDAKKLLFAQQLVSGVVDDGEWGGMSKSDISVRVIARDRECCRILERFLYDYTKGATDLSNRSIAVLYGAYHISDLRSRFISLGLTELPGEEYLTAWSISRKYFTTANEATASPIDIIRSNFSLISIAIVYLIVGAIDWVLVIRFISESLEDVLLQVSSSSSLDLTTGATFFYLILYVWRHIWLQSYISSVGIQWDRGLFD